MASVNPADKKTHLSKATLQMKFMQRGAVRQEQEQLLEAEKRAIDDEHWVLDVPEMAQKENRFVTEASYAICAGLVYGRRSFGGFNPEIERFFMPCSLDCGFRPVLYAMILDRNPHAMYPKNMSTDGNEEIEAKCEQNEREDTVDDVEMADRYSSLVGTLGKKLSKKRKSETTTEDIIKGSVEPSSASKKSKKKFLKPSD